MFSSFYLYFCQMWKMCEFNNCTHAQSFIFILNFQFWSGIPRLMLVFSEKHAALFTLVSVKIILGHRLQSVITDKISTLIFCFAFFMTGVEWYVGFLSIMVRGHNVWEQQNNCLSGISLQMWRWTVWGSFQFYMH